MPDKAPDWKLFISNRSINPLSARSPMKEELITIEFFYDFLMANSARKKLRDKNIFSLLVDKNNPDPLREIELKVFAKDLETAFEILSE